MPLISHSGEQVTKDYEQGGFTHGFVFEFENEADRDYYTKDDPTHQEFVGSIKDIIQNARVVDFSPGIL